MSDVFNQTLKDAGKYKTDAYKKVKDFDPNATFEHFTQNPDQVKYYEGVTQSDTSALNQDAMQNMIESDTGAALLNSINQRPQFVINPNDPAIKNSELIQNEADNIIHGVTDQYIDCKAQESCHIDYQTEVCYESTINQFPTCRKNRVVTAEAQPAATQTVKMSIQVKPNYININTVSMTVDLISGQITNVQKGSLQDYTILPRIHTPPCKGLKIEYLGIEGADPKHPIQMQVDEEPSCNNHFKMQIQLIRKNLWYLNHFMNIKFSYRFTAEVSPVIKESFTQDCNYFESLKAAGVCHTLKPDVCVSGPATHIINNIPVTRDCWAYQSSFECNTGSSPNNCGALQTKKCEQTSSECQQKIGNVCLNYQQTYRCPLQTCSTISNIVCGDGKDYCLDGSCTDHSYEQSKDFGKAMVALSATDEATQSFDADSNFIFKGKSQKCRDDALEFSNCCNEGGWGQDIHLAHCTDEEKALGENRENKITVYVGTYCSNHLPPPLDNICTEHKESYCIFSSKLARIIQDEGRRKQLGINFGNAKNPDCRGVTPDELEKIDLSKIDFTEDFYDDINKKVKIPDMDALKQSIQQHIEQFEQAGQPSG